MANTFGREMAPARDAAFVVHVTDVGDAIDDAVRGRVEHVCSGRTARFASMHELLCFMRETLARLDADP